MRRKKFLIYPRLCDRKGDVSKQWYVELSMRNPVTGNMVRRRFEEFGNEKLNKFLSSEERRLFAQKIIDMLNKRLAEGWSIFDEEPKCVYVDEIQYGTAAKQFQAYVDSTSNYKYWVSRYIKEQLVGLYDDKGETLRTYRSRYRVFGNWLEKYNWETIDISFINNSIIVQFFTYLKNDRKLCSRTYNSYQQLISDLFKYVFKHGGISDNPVRDLPKCRTERDMGAERIMAEDLKVLMPQIDKYDAQLGFAARWQYYCGMRPGYEIRWLKIGDIDFKRGIVRIPAEISKTDRTRKIAIPNVFMKYIINEWHLDVFDNDLFVFGNKGRPGTIPYGKNTLRNRFNQMRDTLKLPKHYKFYSFKHTGAVTLAEQGESIINIRDHLGHTSIETTEHYLKRLGFNESKIIRSNFPEL